MSVVKWLIIPMIGFAGAASAGSLWDSMGLPSPVDDSSPPAGILRPDAKQGFAGAVALGYIATSGNTDSSSFDARFNISYTDDRWFHTVALGAQRVKSDGETTLKRLDFDGQSDYLFTKHNYVFGHVSYARHMFGAYEWRTSEAVGYGRRVLSERDMTLDFEAGVGGTQSRDTGEPRDSAAIVRLGAKYQWNFSENGVFGQAVAVETSADNTYAEWVTTLRANLVKTLAIVLSYTIKYNTDVPAYLVNRDSYTAVSLQYSF